MPSILPAPAFRPQVTVVTPALDSHRLPVGAQIRLAAGEHAVAQLTVLTPVTEDRAVLEQSVPAAMIFPDGSPAHFTYSSSAADTYDFYGYVASHRKLHTEGVSRVTGVSTLPVQYTLTGTSMVMQDARNRAFPHATASSVARQVAADNHLASYVSAHPRLFAAKIQAGASDFAFLQALARQVGYQCWVDNSLLYFADPALSLDPAGTLLPTFRRDAIPGVWDTLAAFASTVGETDPSGSYLTAHTATTLRSASGLLAAARATPLRGGGAPRFGRMVKGQLASSYADAQSVAAAAASAHRYWVSATATVDGHTALRPGRSVNLAGAALTAADQGAWRIQGAVHRIGLDAALDTRNTYQVDLELGRDQVSALNLRAARPAAPAPGAMTLSGGAWRAASRGGAR